MRRTFALIVVVAVGLMAAPAAGANPNAVEWVETDVMGPPTGVVERFAGDWIHEQFSRSGTFEATADGVVYSGTVEWDAAGKVKLDFSDPENPRPVFGTFRGKGTYVFESGDGMVGTECRLTFQSKLVEDFTRPAPNPPFVFYGNQVAHCDNGSMIHGQILGPTGPGTGEPRAFSQEVTGTLKK